MKKTILALTVAALTAMSLPMVANAAEPAAPQQPSTARSAVVNIEAKATTVNVTMPATAPIVFKEDGTNTYPTNFNITNNSAIAGVHITKIDLTGADDWKVASESFDTKTLPKNERTIKIKLGKAGQEKLIAPTKGDKNAAGSANYNPTDFAVAAKGTETMNFSVERGAFTSAIPAAKAFDMNVNFDFN